MHLSYEQACELFHYERETGTLVWKSRPDNKAFNTRFAGKIAGSMSQGYVCINAKGRGVLAHRVIWLLETGKAPDMFIDHISGVRTDNRFSNLRQVTPAESSRNLPTPRTNTSGHVGIYYQPKIDKWMAKIQQNGKVKTLGVFRAKEDAIRVRKEAERRLGYHPNHGREFQPL